jgi:hypothetical protein
MVILLVLTRQQVVRVLVVKVVVVMALPEVVAEAQEVTQVMVELGRLLTPLVLTELAELAE